MSINRLEEALRLVSLGWAIIPLHTPIIGGGCSCEALECKSPGKHPRTPNGVKDASKEQEQISKWWEQWPDANIGIATGGISGIVVVDIDPRHNGDESLFELQKDNEQLPATVEVLTGGGGRHLYYLCPDRPIRTRANVLPGIDIRGEGGYVVGPSSFHSSGQLYEWEISSQPDSIDMPVLPGWFLGMLENAGYKSSFPGQIQVKQEDWVGDALNNLKEGNRNETFTSISGYLLRHGLPANAILAFLNPHAKQSGFPPGELICLVDGMFRRYGKESRVKRFTTVSLHEYLQIHYEEITWLVDKILPSQAAMLIAGPGGKGKTWLLMDLGVSIASGSKWMGEFQTESAMVLYVDEESSHALVTARIKRLLAARGMESSRLPVQLAVGKGLRLSDSSSVNELRDEVERHKPRLVIVDSLIRVHGADENSASDMAKVFSAAKAIMRDYNCSFVFADHSRKQGNNGFASEVSLRGSSEKMAWADSVLSIRSKEGVIVVEHIKARFGEAVQSFLVKITDPAPNMTEVRYCGDAKAHTEAINKQEALELLSDILRQNSGPVPRKDLIDAAADVDISQKIVDGVLKRYEGKFWIREDAKTTEGRGGRSACFRWIGGINPFPFPPSIRGETETDSDEPSGCDSL